MLKCYRVMSVLGCLLGTIACSASAQDYIWTRQSSDLRTMVAAKVSIVERSEWLQMFAATGPEDILDFDDGDVSSSVLAATSANVVTSGSGVTYGEANATGQIGVNPDGQVEFNTAIAGAGGAILDTDLLDATWEYFDIVAASANAEWYAADVVYRLDRVSTPTGSTDAEGFVDWTGLSTGPGCYFNLDIELKCGEQMMFYINALWLGEGETDVNVGFYDWDVDEYGPFLNWFEETYSMDSVGERINFLLPTMSTGTELTLSQRCWGGADVFADDYSYNVESQLHTVTFSVTTDP